MTTNGSILNSPCEETTKAAYRFKVWNDLENRDLVRFPRPCKGRIPNFVDNILAAEKLSAEPAFKDAQVIMVNVDKPQEPVRFLTLEAGKTLVIPMARNDDGLLTKICPPADAGRDVLRAACQRRGIGIYGKGISLDEKIHVDMIVIGSVAVSKEGHHIGKSRGYSDLEYAILAANGAVTKDTLIVTTVHDTQVFDTLPQNLFEPYDVPVDLIVTPTQIVNVSPRLARPERIMWNILSDRRLQQLPLLKTLRTKEIEKGNECPLKEVDSEPEEHPRPYYRPTFPFRRPFYQRPRRDFNHSVSPARAQIRHTRTFHRRRPTDSTSVAKDESVNKKDKKVNDENKENRENKPLRRQQKRFNRNRIPVDFSVKVGNIESTVRVRDLKAALIEKGVRPRTIIWQGPRGFALLQFAKMKAEPEQPTAVDDVIASLQGLKVKFESKNEVKEAVLSIEPAKPISRIENAGVTAV